MPTRAFCLLGLLWAIGCGGDDGGGASAPVPIGDGGTTGRGMHMCEDDDGDGFGPYCGVGMSMDCEPDNPDVTDECVRCVKPNLGCPCEDGTKPMTGCTPKDMRGTKDGMVGTFHCTEGTRYCRDGAWSDCEFIAQYTSFIADK